MNQQRFLYPLYNDITLKQAITLYKKRGVYITSYDFHHYVVVNSQISFITNNNEEF